MSVFVDIFCRGVGSFLKTVVRKSVHDDVVIFLDKGLDDSEACQPASGVDKKGIDSPELC
jgi:hypothetical protein